MTTDIQINVQSSCQHKHRKTDGGKHSLNFLLVHVHFNQTEVQEPSGVAWSFQRGGGNCWFEIKGIPTLADSRILFMFFPVSWPWTEHRPLQCLLSGRFHMYVAFVDFLSMMLCEAKVSSSLFFQLYMVLGLAETCLTDMKN